jgi:hypothetical protein
MGDFNDDFGMGFNIHSSVYVEFSPVAAAGLGGGFNYFGFDADVGGLETDGGAAKFFNICPEMRFMVGTADMPTFAFVVGAGYYRLTQSDLTLTDPITTMSETYEFEGANKFGINTAGKFGYPITPNVKIGAEGMLHLIFTEEDDPLSGPDYNTLWFNFSVVLIFTGGT